MPTALDVLLWESTHFAGIIPLSKRLAHKADDSGGPKLVEKSLANEAKFQGHRERLPTGRRQSGPSSATCVLTCHFKSELITDGGNKTVHLGQSENAFQPALVFKNCFIAWV